MNGGTKLNDVCSGTSSPKLCSSPLIHCKLHWGFVNVAKLWSSIAQLCLTNNCSLLSSDKFLLLQVWEFNVHRASYLSLAPPKSTDIELPAWCDDSYSYQDGDKPGLSVRNISWQCATLTTWFGFKHQMEESEDRMYFSEKCRTMNNVIKSHKIHHDVLYWVAGLVTKWRALVLLLVVKLLSNRSSYCTFCGGLMFIKIFGIWSWGIGESPGNNLSPSWLHMLIA